MKLLTFTLFTLLLFTMVGCSNGDDPVPSPSPLPNPSPPSGNTTLSDLESNGSLPVLDRSDSLTGQDEDTNGVRDDIDAFINATYSLDAERQASTQMASAFQNTLTVDVSNSDDVRSVLTDQNRAINCMSQSFSDLSEGTKAVNQLESITANTKPRLQAYLAFNKAVSGSVFSLPSGDTCDE